MDDSTYVKGQRLSEPKLAKYFMKTLQPTPYCSRLRAQSNIKRKGGTIYYVKAHHSFFCYGQAIHMLVQTFKNSGDLAGIDLERTAAPMICHFDYW